MNDAKNSSKNNSMPKSNFALKHCENDSIFNQMTQCSSRGKYNQQQSGKCDCIFSQASLQRVCNGTFDHTFIVAGATTNMQIDPTIIIMLANKQTRVKLGDQAGSSGQSFCHMFETTIKFLIFIEQTSCLWHFREL